MVEIKLAHLPEGIAEATIQAWYVEEGDAVVKGDEIVELSTEEGIFTLTASASGILSEVYYDEGESVNLGEVLCLIEEEGFGEEKAKEGDAEEE